MYYLRLMENLPVSILKDFLDGNHVMRHQDGLWNAIWSDMFIETTAMRYGHGPGGLKGIEQKENSQTRWALSQHICSQMIKDLYSMESSTHNEVTMHKEEGQNRMENDEVVRNKLCEKLAMCIDPLDPSQHLDGLVNIVTGRVAPENVNVDKSVELGRKQMKEFESSLPGGFRKPISRIVITMAAAKKNLSR